MTEKLVVTTKGFVRADFSFWVGLYMDRFYDSLENKKVIGNKCTKCGKVFVPPRKICGECNEIIPLDNNWVNLPNTGTLLNYTITYYKVSDRTARKAKKTQIIGLVQIDGSDTAIAYRLLKIEPDEIKIGMKLKIEWEEKTKGNPADIKGFMKI
ncbi:MAG: Zn-ribbon domain-containing OB-fold protein [Candidatus Thorarchaeota archaeon]